MGEDSASFATFGESFTRNGLDSSPAHQAEDAYEAALRAADALFAPPAAKTGVAGQASTALANDASGAYDPSPTDHDSGVPSPAVSVPTMASPTVSGTTVFASAAATKLATQRGAEVESPPRGRILRVLDEPPVPGLAELEAERAPKRRGRKPGSKNKPKSAPVAPPPAPAARDAATGAAADRAAELVSPRTISSQTMFAAASASRLPTSMMVSDPVSSSGAPTQEATSPGAATIKTSSREIAFEDESASTPAATLGKTAVEPEDSYFSSWDSEPARPAPAWSAPPRPAPTRPAAAPVVSDASAPASRAEPYGWVRTKLAPGERWKRRLPKVCW